MTREQINEAIEVADRLADCLDVMTQLAKENRAGENNGDVSSVNEVVRIQINLKAAKALANPLKDAIEIAKDAPTVDDGGSGDGALNPDFLNRLVERDYPRIKMKLVVEIDVDDDGDTLEVNLL